MPFDSDELVDASVTTMATLVSAPPDAAPLLNMNVLDAATMALDDAADEAEAAPVPVGEDGAGGGAISVAVATAAGGSMAVLVAPSSVLTVTTGFSPSSASSSARCFFVPAAHAWFCCTRKKCKLGRRRAFYPDGVLRYLLGSKIDEPSGQGCVVLGEVGRREGERSQQGTNNRASREEKKSIHEIGDWS